jgi:lysylphosphatidylglycerol synthetase-like protein (DUF2156 family)
VVVHVGLALVFVLEVPVRCVGVQQGGVIVLVLVRRAQVLESAGTRIVVVGHVVVGVTVYQPLVFVLFCLGHVATSSPFWAHTDHLR